MHTAKRINVYPGLKHKMKNKEEVSVIKSAINYYKAAIKEYQVLGSMNDVLQSMIADLLDYTCDPLPADWQTLAGKLYEDLNVLIKSGEDAGITNANILSPLSSASQIARNLTKLNKSEPTQKLCHYYEAIRNNLCDALKNISPNPNIVAQKAYVDYDRLVHDGQDGLVGANNQLRKLQNPKRMPDNYPDIIHDVYDIVDSVFEGFSAYKLHGLPYNNPVFMNNLSKADKVLAEISNHLRTGNEQDYASEPWKVWVASESKTAFDCIYEAMTVYVTPE